MRNWMVWSVMTVAAVTTLLAFGANAADGDFVWAKAVGGTGMDGGVGVAVDGPGNIYTTGDFSGTVDFDLGPGTFNLTSQGGEDIFVSKLDNAGSFVWAKAMGGTTGRIRVKGIAVDGAGNVYTTGDLRGTGDFDPGPGTFNLTSAKGSLDIWDIFVSKLDSAGDFVWAKSMGGTKSNGHGIAVDAAGNVYTMGDLRGTGDYDPGPGTFNLTSAAASWDTFVSKLDGAGGFVWAKAMGGPGIDEGCGIAVDGAGNVYTTGDFQGTADFDPGPGTFSLTSAGGPDIFVSKLDSAGDFLWAKTMGGTGDDRSGGIAVDSAGNAYATGYFGYLDSGAADFDPGPGTFNLTSAGGSDIFVSKLDSAGSFVWAKAMGGTSEDDSGSGIAVDGAGNVYTTGLFGFFYSTLIGLPDGGTADFDPGPGTFNLTARGGCDIFVSKLSGPQPITFTSPNGGEYWDPGSEHNICWSSFRLMGHVRL